MRFVLAAGLAVLMGIAASARAEVPAAQSWRRRPVTRGIAAERPKWQEVVKASAAHVD